MVYVSRHVTMFIHNEYDIQPQYKLTVWSVIFTLIWLTCTHVCYGLCDWQYMVYTCGRHH